MKYAKMTQLTYAFWLLDLHYVSEQRLEPVANHLACKGYATFGICNFEDMYWAWRNEDRI